MTKKTKPNNFLLQQAEEFHPQQQVDFQQKVRHGTTQTGESSSSLGGIHFC
jgi:hypothetical protein